MNNTLLPTITVLSVLLYGSTDCTGTQGGNNVTAIINKTNGDTMRGTLETEEISLDLDTGLRVEAVYKDKFARILVDRARNQAPVQFGVQQPILDESDGIVPIEVGGDGMVNSLGIRLRYIKPGEFWMGSPGNEQGHDEDESPQHLVRLSKGFYLATTEVTQKQWVSVMGSRPWSGKDNVKEADDCPATYVSWEDATDFCKKLSQKEGRHYRLPTEAEWEYACRAGTRTAYSFGNSASQLGDYAWFDDNADEANEKYAHAIGQKKPNPWGLYDMHGNVWEWCEDWYAEDAYPGNAVTDPKGPSSGRSRVLRGGSWFNNAEYCRSARRIRISPGYGNSRFGFRIVLDAK